MGALSAVWRQCRGVLAAVGMAAWAISGPVPAQDPSGAPALRVGPTEAVKTIAEAARLAKDGTVVEIAAGEYHRDVAVWTQKDITIRGVGGQAKVYSDGLVAERKGIWVMRGGRAVVENVEFYGARVPEKNGAGIRLEKGALTVRNCAFLDNENGILTNNDASIELEIEDSEFGRNGAGDGQSHNLYAGSIAKLTVTGSHFHTGRVGHLLKSRAKENFIKYNRLTDDIEGRASYELEFPAGGLAVVVGNLIQQCWQTENAVIVSFGAEGYKWPRNELYLSHNTLVNDREKGGVFVFAAPGQAKASLINNIVVGKGTFEIKVPFENGGTTALDWEHFVLPQRLDYRLKAASRVVGTAKDPGQVNGAELRPRAEPKLPLGSETIPAGTPLSPGAFQKTAKR
jgi:hypothetical protein